MPPTAPTPSNPSKSNVSLEAHAVVLGLLCTAARLAWELRQTLALADLAPRGLSPQQWRVILLDLVARPALWLSAMGAVLAWYLVLTLCQKLAAAISGGGDKLMRGSIAQGDLDHA